MIRNHAICLFSYGSSFGFKTKTSKTVRLHKPRKNSMNPDLGHHKNTCKPPLPKPYLSHQITKTRDASQTQKNLEKHTNIPAFFFFSVLLCFPDKQSQL